MRRECVYAVPSGCVGTLGCACGGTRADMWTSVLLCGFVCLVCVCKVCANDLYVL